MDFEKVNSIREVFTYIERFSGALFVLKIEDSILHHPLFPMLMKDIVQMHHTGIKVILVPGTRAAIDRYLETFKLKTSFHEGVRLTTQKALPFVKLAASEVSNTILTQLAANGAQGLVGNWVKAHSLGVLKGVDFARTGKIIHIRADIVSKLLDEGFIPIIPNIGWNDVGRTYNISSNNVAAQICIDLQATKLFFIGEEDGFAAENLRLPDNLFVNSDGIVPNLSAQQAKQILNENENIPFVQKDFLENALRAIENGTHRIHIASARNEGSVLQEVFSSSGGGTMVFNNEYEHIRAAKLSDVPKLLTLMDSFIDTEALVPRTQKDIQNHIEDYQVYEVDQVLHGCGALQTRSTDIAELCAVTVDSAYQSTGVGRKLVESLLKKARNLSLRKVYLLTTQAEDWFLSFGFESVDVQEIPRAGQLRYRPERGSKILMIDLSKVNPSQ